MHYIDTNLDFEYEIIHGQRPQQRKITERLNAWHTLLRILPECQHAHPLQTHHTLVEGDKLTTWGWTARHHAINSTATSPSPQIVKQANSKCTSHQIERELNVELPSACIIHTFEEGRQWIEQTPYPWVIKHPFGVSGRDRIVGQPHHCEPRLERWLAKQLKTTPCVAEPWLTKQQERSTQLWVHPDGQHTILGTLDLHCDNTGTFRGHHITPADQHPPALQTPKQIDQLVHTLHTMGYHGPVGIDAMTGTLPGTSADHALIIRPIMEINARYTFGHMALALRDHLPPNQHATWTHPDRHTSPQPNLPICAPEHTEPGTYRLPEHIDPGNRTRSTIQLHPKSH